ncbi:hypothetical protein GCM10028820_31490 [Tessaracoccus terricola]
MAAHTDPRRSRRPAITSSQWGKTTTAFDTYGRATSSTVHTSAADTVGRTNTTVYSPATGGPVTGVTITNPLGHTETTTFNLDGQVIKEVDTSGRTTEATYDALGRVSAVWEPGFPRTGPATRNHSYTTSLTGPDTVTTKTTTAISGTTPTQQTSIELYDAMGQLIQTQTQAVGSGRVVDDVFYDSHGWPIRTNNHWYTTGTPSTTRITTNDTGVDSRTVTQYDGLGRATAVIDYTGLTETRRTRTVHGGDRTTVFPPTGGPIQATIVDGLGQTRRLLEYTTAPTISGNTVTGGAFKTTQYTYDPLGQLKTMTDPTGAAWSWTYDLAGRRTQTVDPDTGTTNFTYNHAGDKLTSVDARGTAGTLKYTYDNLGRTTKLVGGVGDKTLAQWTWDTLKPGMLTESRSYVDGNTTNAYIQKVTGYDTYARPTGHATVIPASETGLAGTYSTSLTYTPTGQVKTQTLPALGGLPAETITRTYNAQGLPHATTGTNQYVNSVTYTPFGTPSQVVGRENNTLIHTTNYDPETLKIASTALNGQTTRPQIVKDTLTRNKAGMITRTTTEMNYNNPAAVRTMCYNYDTRARLSQAWTSLDNCATAPTSTNSNVFGFLPIWYQWTHNDAGVRTKQTQNKLPTHTNPTITTTHTLGVTGHAHATKTETTTTTGAATTTTNYTYDATGNTTKTVTGTTTETLTWDALGKLTTTTKSGATTSYIRDANGDILLRKDPGGTTAYTAAGEVRLTGTTTKTGTRTYTHNGQTIAQRVGNTTLQALYTDRNGTATVALTWSNLAESKWQFQDPYGNPIYGGGIGTWSTDHKFLNLPTDPTTGYVQTGARLYNPKNGRFLSVDPLLDPTTPQLLNGYSYTANDPINTSDPTGLDFRIANTDTNSGTGDAPRATQVRRAKSKAVAVPIEETLRIGIVVPPGLGAGMATRGRSSLDAIRNGEFASFGRALAGLEKVTRVLDTASSLTNKSDEDDIELYYRGMTKEQFALLQRTGKLQATSETFISPSKQYAGKYAQQPDEVLVELRVKAGTKSQLEGMGVRDKSFEAMAHYPMMPTVPTGWTTRDLAYFKYEFPNMNIGLGRSGALRIFNDNLVSWEEVK